MYRIFWNKNFDSLKIKSLLVLKTPLSQLPGQTIWVYRLQRTISLKIHLLWRHQENFLQWNWLKQRVNLSRNAYRLKKCFRTLVSELEITNNYLCKKNIFWWNYRKIEFQDSLKDEVEIEEIDSMNLAPRTKKVN